MFKASGSKKISISVDVHSNGVFGIKTKGFCVIFWILQHLVQIVCIANTSEVIKQMINKEHAMPKMCWKEKFWDWMEAM